MLIALPMSIIPGVDDMILSLIIIVVAVGIVALAAKHMQGHKPATTAQPTVAARPAPPRAERIAEVPSEKVDEDVVRLKVEKTATESALKSLESAMKEGAIAKDTFEKYKATYDGRLKKIDVELSRRSKGPVAIPKLEGEVDKVRQSYLERLKDLSKKAISVPPLEAAVARPPAVPSAKPPMKLPQVPSARDEEVTEKPLPPPAREVSPEVIPQEPLSAARATPTSPATIADLRREMMDELNRLKRLIGHAGS